MTKISVIIPTLNEETSIASLLSRLIGITGIEIIVSDGGSTDRTAEQCRAMGVIFLPGPPGRGRQLNVAVRHASGDALFFLHADSIVEENVFNDIRQALHSGDGWGCCSLYFNEQSFFFRLLGAASRWRARIFSSCYGDQGIYCSRGLFNQIGGFPEIPFLEDLAFSHHLRRMHKARMLPGKIITSTRRFRQYGLWKTLLKMQVVKTLFSLGVPPARLLEFYQAGRE
ncbi:MAG: TIGR04283 family arsenosugar biosynthesis glycosyltransferase [Bacillota bacterium]